MTHSNRVKKDDPETRDRVGLQTDGEAPKAHILVNEPAAAAPLIQRLIKSGFIVDISSDPIQSLGECRGNKPDLAVVDEKPYDNVRNSLSFGSPQSFMDYRNHSCERKR